MPEAATTVATSITRVSSSRLRETLREAPEFGTVFSDHMLVADYADGAWRQAKIVPYGPISFSPSMSALHYGQAIFEGFKAHRTADGGIALFRYADNLARLNRSASRLAMPEVPAELFLEGIASLVRLDHDWIPSGPGGGLYLRPVYFATDEALGVRPSSRYKLVVLACPTGPFFSEPISLLAEETDVRAFPGGTGNVKAAGNYAGGMRAMRQAKQRGFDNVLWLDGRERRYVEEGGVMNLFFIVDGAAITPPLGGTILPGVTRDSLITLLRDDGMVVRERAIAIDEVLDAHGAGRLTEAFGVGTAAIVAPIKRIRKGEREINLLPLGERSVAQRARSLLEAVQTGRAPDTRGWLTLVD